MQSKRWLGFGLTGALTRTVVHFFPSAGSVTVPHAALVTLSLLPPPGASPSGEQRIALEGARFSQPDGVRMEDAFPGALQKISGLFGIRVEISTNEPRVDLGNSHCVIEITTQGKSCRYSPGVTRDLTEERPPAEALPAFPILKDPYQVTSLVVVNGEAAPITPALSEAAAQPGLAALVTPLSFSASAVPPHSVGEVSFEDEANARILETLSPRECGWGLVRSRAAILGGVPKGAAAFAVYRDVVNRRPVSVVAL